MIPKIVQCKNCGSNIEIRTWRRFVVCPYCDTKIPFDGFEYREIDWNDSMYSGVEYLMDCPACRSHNMYLGAEKRLWRCPDCGYSVSNREKRFGVFWFCDNCEAYLNVQNGFTTKNGIWRCSECGAQNDVTKNSIL